ncbi:MAG: sigma-54-dependent Fis family transcriptional regulator [Deltaproteobacteria bacterium]|nr:sigma-54-dependent Fis family transcriptional regulator [Deltaproteobacteria bacterium]
MASSGRPRILIVDDEPNMCRSLRIMLNEEDRYDVLTESESTRALSRVEEPFDLVVTDLSMPGADGLEVLRRAKAANDGVQVVIMTAYSTVESAVEAMKAGAFEYVIKPFSNEEMLLTVEKALKAGELKRESQRSKTRLRERTRGADLIGESEPMRSLRALIERAAERDATVLITGESGVGKELVARAIHFAGARAEGPFVPVNCAALTESLLESELFGHERGAFTGAVRTKIGRLEQAHGGTLFLDEVGDMSPALQTKLLRALEDRAFTRVGGIDLVQADVRFVAATHRDLPRAIADGTFREDLYYRLNVIPIQVPSLRERREDVPLLVEHFLREGAPAGEQSPVSLSPEAHELLLNYGFPGNVRELQNIIERARLLADTPVIGVAELPLQRPREHRPKLDQVVTSLEDGWLQLQELVKDLERQLVERALEVYGGRPNGEIAAILGTSRRILELRIQEFALAKPRPRG